VVQKPYLKKTVIEI